VTSERPLLLVDVDGVISLFGFGQTSMPEGRFCFVDGIPHLISAYAGQFLVRLATSFECVWCTGWEERAEEHLPALLGLTGGWPHLAFTDPPVLDAHWKLGAIARHTGPDRPVAWVDDAHDERCHAWAAARRGPTLLVTTSPEEGLTEAQVERLEAWARAHGDPGKD
jgi:hypothetical protein